MVGVPRVNADKSDTTEFTNEENHLVGRLGNVRLEHEELFGLVEESFGLVECGGVDANWMCERGNCEERGKREKQDGVRGDDDNRYSRDLCTEFARYVQVE